MPLLNGLFHLFPAGYDRGDTVDIPLDSSSDLKKKENVLQAKEAELKRREHVISVALLPLSSDRVDICPMKVVDFARRGGPGVLGIKEVPNPSLTYNNKVIIQVAAAGLNIYDTWRRQGIPGYRCDFSRYLGYECSGKVVAVGSAVFKFKEGDEVCAILQLGGGYAEFVAVEESHVLPIPSGVSLVDAAALPLASQLAVYALSMLTNVTAGKRVLMHGSASGIGTIALQYAKHVGCQVFAVAEKEEELHLCKKLGAEVCINYKEQDFCKRAKAETGEKGVDIVLDLSGRDHFQKNLDCLARGGSLVIFEQKLGSRVNVDLSVIVEKDINVVGGDVFRQGLRASRETKSHMLDIVAKIWPLIEAGHIQPIIGKIFSFSEAGEAHRALEKCSIPGKLLLVPG